MKVFRINKENKIIIMRNEELKQENNEILQISESKKNGFLQKIGEQESIIEDLISENSKLLIDMFNLRKETVNLNI